MPYYENTNPSRFEIKISKLLDSGDILYATEFSFLDLKSDRGVPLRFDFALFETPEDFAAERPKALIEAQGEQHFTQKFTTREQFARQQANDKRKRNYCNAKGICLLAIPYTEYNTMTLDSILEKCHFFD